MSLFIEEEGNIKLDFDTEEIAALVIDAALELADCPYDQSSFNRECPDSRNESGTTWN